ncbi:Vegetative incompatibility protein HET-E-1 [Cyphellophora attinorum]|uniref:Vegetative incompatibility protein HET-E-1 n=1 Tax=Cyphellophora attinorum TaxID=1664694 RepID=A0A0N0NRK6_9EURO|nr:Vegetative incompatibility protein HET-E-1 [Phialophora attinorum]KPI44959.1 Vegetative incompatibility protein HET-E-1 [Phialophora attinorum]
MANPPGPYAILSHTWGPVEDEVSVEDLRKGMYGGKIGFAKLRYCARQAKVDGLDYCWIDTCCIDKSSSAELSEAINSMYQWYENAVVCYVYLSDIERVDEMERSAWFTRGWTLQELIAPTKIAIYNRHWTLLGSKHGLHGRLCKITGVPVRILRGKSPRDCSIAQRMSWAAQRQTTRPEDIAYCLLGLFDINMSMLYGEGSKAFRRLQLEIMQVSNDHSILAWNRLDDVQSQDLLARSPADFRSCTDVVTTDSTDMPEPFSMTNVGLSIALPMRPWAMHTYLAVLECQDQAQHKDLMPTWRKDTGHSRLGIFLRQTHRKGQFIRVACVGHRPRSFEVKASRRKIRIAWRKPTRGFEPDADLRIGTQRQQTVSVESQEDAKLRTRRVLIRQQANAQTDYEEDFMYGFLFRNMLENTIMSSNPPERRTWTDGLTVKGQYGQILGNENNVLIVTLSTGEGGTVSVFDALTTTPSRNAALIAFGFDFDFNPVCRVKTFNTTEEHKSSSQKWISTLHNTWPDQWIQSLDRR